MFETVKQIFKKKPKQVAATDAPVNESLAFQDRKLQQISLEIKPAGNETVLMLTEKKSNTEIALDQEICFVLAAVLQEYSLNGNIRKIIKEIEKGE